MSKNIPVLHAEGKTLPEAYEKSLLALAFNGCKIKTQYDKPEDPPSIDATMNITIESPDADPMIYRLFPGGMADLREYVLELAGAKDHWVRNANDPADKRWDYTYHQRLAVWGSWREDDELVCAIPAPINQLDAVVKKLVESPYTRRAQAITWMPFIDYDVFDPPCLQSLWFRMTEETNGDYYLNTNIRFRSNDAWGAAYMNMFGLTQFIRTQVANPVEEQLGRPVFLGRINWQADSYHIYGKDINGMADRLLKRVMTTDFSDRVWNFADKEMQDAWHEAEAVIRKKIEDYDKEHKK